MNLSKMLQIILLLIACLCIACTKVEESAKETPKHGNQDLELSKEAIIEMTTRAEKGDAEAAFKLSLHYEFGAAERDHKKGFYWTQKAAERGHPVAQYSLAQFYIHLPEHKNVDQALFWLKKAAQNGNELAQESLSYWIPKEEIAKVTNQAEAGDAKAAFRLYEFYRHYEPDDFERSIQWLKKAAANGHIEAQKDLRAKESKK